MSRNIALVFTSLVILEGSLLSFPLVFVLLLTSAIKRRENWILPLAFAAGLILDSLYLRPLGVTSLFFLLFLFAIFTYGRKFEIDNLTFVFISSFLGSMIFLLVFGESQILLKSFLSSVLSLILSKLW